MSQSNAIDELLLVTLWGCSECLQWATDDAWNDAWRAERRVRSHDPAFADEDEWGEDYGLADRMLCPRCHYLHADDECSYVDEERVLVTPPDKEPG